MLKIVSASCPVFATSMIAMSAGMAHAAPTIATQQNLGVYDSVQNDFISGQSTPIDNFVTSSGPGLNNNTVSVAIKARDRDTGEPNGVNGNHYYVDAGQSSERADRPNLVFDYQFSPGTDNVTNYRLQLSFDVDPTSGQATAITSMPIHGGTVGNPSFDQGDGYFLTNTEGAGGTNAWNDQSVSYVISNTTNLGFLILPPFLAYNSATPGDYNFRIDVFGPNDSTALASAYGIVTVPEPTTLAVFGLGAIGLLARRRRVVAA